MRHRRACVDEIDAYARLTREQADTFLAEAGRTPDPAKREPLLQRAVRMAMEDVAIAPLYIQKAIFAARRGLQFEPRVDEVLDVAAVRPAP